MVMRAEGSPQSDRRSPLSLFLIAASWGNLALIREWIKLADSPGTYTFYHHAPQRPADFGAATISAAIVTAILWLLLTVVHRAPSTTVRFRVAAGILVATACGVVNQIRQAFLGDNGYWTAVLLVFSVLMLCWKGSRRLALNGGVTALLCLSPFAASGAERRRHRAPLP